VHGFSRCYHLLHPYVMTKNCLLIDPSGNAHLGQLTRNSYHYLQL
jgi:hypothetical protein